MVLYPSEFKTTGNTLRLARDDVFRYEYDDGGARTRRVRLSNDPADDYEVEYAWDIKNRLARVTFKNNAGQITRQVDQRYDMFNRWIASTVDPDGAGDIKGGSKGAGLNGT